MTANQEFKERQERTKSEGIALGSPELTTGDVTRKRREKMDGIFFMLEQNPFFSVLLFSLMFRVVHHLLRKLPLPKVVEHDELRSWKWRNLSVSLVHSLLTGPWAITW